MKLLTVLALFLLLTLPLYAQQLNLTVDRVYDLVIGPLQKENYQLRMQVIFLSDQVAALQKELASLKNPPKETKE